VYDVVVKKVHVRYLISWWVSCLFIHSKTQGTKRQSDIAYGTRI